MKLIIKGEYASKQDIMEICQFLREKWKTRADTLLIQVIEGTEDLNVKQLQEFVKQVFNGELDDENILIIEKKKNATE